MIGGNNPVLNENTFAQFGQNAFGGTNLPARTSVMTISGAINASFILLSLCVASAGVAWWAIGNNPALAMPFTLGGAIVGVILGLVISFKPQTAGYLAPVYALVEGLFVGGLSFVYAGMAVGTKWGGATGSGIIAAAAGLTLAVLFAMLGVYKFGIIKPTEKFKSCMYAAIGGVCLFSVAVLLLGLFGVNTSWMYNGPIAIAISAVIVGVASFSLILDFDTIEQGAAAGAPKYMEWYAGFGLLVTLVWLNSSSLRLLSSLNRRD